MSATLPTRRGRAHRSSGHRRPTRDEATIDFSRWSAPTGVRTLTPVKGPIPALIASAALAALSAVTIWAQAVVGEPVALLVLDVVSTVVATALVPLVLRRPVPGAVALALLAGVSSAVTPQATAGALFVALQCRLPLALGVGLVGLAAHAVQGWWRPHGGLSYGWWLVLLAASYAALIAWGAFWRANRSLMESLRDRARPGRGRAGAAGGRGPRPGTHAHRLRDARRARPSADAARHLRRRGRVPTRRAPGQVARAAAVVRESAHQALDDLREVIALLRAGRRRGPRPTAAVPGRHPAPAGRVPRGRGNGRTGRPGVRRDAPSRRRPNVRRSGSCRRRVTNARRHAAGAPVRVRLDRAPGDRLRVEISNPVPPGPGMPRPDGAAVAGWSA